MNERRLCECCEAPLTVAQMKKGNRYCSRSCRSSVIASKRVYSPLRVRLLMHSVVDADDCWLWTGYVTQRGYGRTSSAGRTMAAHRASYEEFREQIPQGKELDHLCRVRHCINPWHLEPVTTRENLMRGESPAAVNAAKTHCLRGHAYSGGNLLIRANGARGCRACARAVYHARKKRS